MCLDICLLAYQAKTTSIYYDEASLFQRRLFVVMTVARLDGWYYSSAYPSSANPRAKTVLQIANFP